MKGTELIVNVWGSREKAFVADIDFDKKEMTILSLDDPRRKLFCANQDINLKRIRTGTDAEMFDYAISAIKKGEFNYKDFDKKFPKKEEFLSGEPHCAFE
jgi:hypothetical protein